MTAERRNEMVFYVIVGIVLTGALWRVFSSSSDPTLQGDTRTEIILAAMYGLVGLICVIQFRSTIWLLLQFPALTALLL